jgi:hypothetical protein
MLPWLRKTFNGYFLFMALFVSAFPDLLDHLSEISTAKWLEA